MPTLARVTLVINGASITSTSVDKKLKAACVEKTGVLEVAAKVIVPIDVYDPERMYPTVKTLEEPVPGVSAYPEEPEKFAGSVQA